MPRDDAGSRCQVHTRRAGGKNASAERLAPGTKKTLPYFMRGFGTKQAFKLVRIFKMFLGFVLLRVFSVHPRPILLS